MDKKSQSPINLIHRQAPKWVIDRIEEEWAVLENTETLESISIPLTSLPKKICEGGTLIKINSKWYLNEAETAARKTRINDRFERLKKGGGTS
ncbi:MAG: DUF3006 domain-containing protein [Defluviitaleaceae bacterium]|nr:DUF3006 domain-containing protein [Defluviitaleaceae bacterium]